MHIYSGADLQGIQTYYRVWRAREAVVYGDGWMPVSDWTTERDIVDDQVVPEQVYYYFLQVSPHAEGWYDSGFSAPQTGYAEP